VYVRSAAPLPAPRAPLPIAGTPATIAQVGWIGRMWEGTAGGTTTEERWTPPASGGMIGVSRTLRGASTLAAYEQLCISERNGTLVYFAMPNGRVPATAFVATEVVDGSVTFSNPQHDYPQAIRYTRTPSGDLETVISLLDGTRAVRTVLRKSP
jgi:hypothetical protein